MDDVGSENYSGKLSCGSCVRIAEGVQSRVREWQIPSKEELSDTDISIL